MKSYFAQKEAIERTAMAASDVCDELVRQGRIEEASEVGKFRAIAETTFWELELLDSTTVGEVVLHSEAVHDPVIDKSVDEPEVIVELTKRLRARLDRALDRLQANARTRARPIPHPSRLAPL